MSVDKTQTFTHQTRHGRCQRLSCPFEERFKKCRDCFLGLVHMGSTCIFGPDPGLYLPRDE